MIVKMIAKFVNNLELASAPQQPRAANTMMARPVPSRERDAKESWKISTAIKKRYLFNVFRMTSRAR